MSYCSRSRRRRFTVLYFKFRHRRSFRPRLPIRVQHFGDLATFSVDLCIVYSDCPPYFYFRLVWPTDLEIIPHASTPMLIIPPRLKLIWPSTAELQRFYLLFVTWPDDLDLWPFDLELLSYMASHVTNPATKVEDPTTIRSWVSSYIASIWLP